MPIIFTRVLAATGFILAIAGSAVAESPGYCHDYAAQAVREAGENLAHSCGYSGRRWTVNYREHFEWCLGAARDVTIGERVARRDGLFACRHRH